MRTRSRTRRGAAALTAVAVLAGGCGTQQDVAADALPEERAGTCPDVLPGDDDALAGSDEAPRLPAPDRAWICQYVATEVGRTADGVALLEWRVTSRPAEVAAALLPDLTAAIGEIAPWPRDDEHACTADLGPRWLVGYAAERDLLGVVVEGYGCADVTLTDQPFTAVPGSTTGSGTVAGALASPTSLLELVQAVVGSRARFHRIEPVPRPELPCAPSERLGADLDVPGPGTPDPEDAVRPYADDLPVVLRDATSDEATVDVLSPGGEVLRTFRLTLEDDGWWPDSYDECVRPAY